MTIVEAARTVTGGVDTHLDVHVAAALDPIGALLGTERFDTDSAGYKALLSWLESFGPLCKVGVEGTGSYGAGPRAFPSPKTVPSRPSGSSSWPSARPEGPGSRHLLRCVTW